jgi:hypothetical protein
MPLHHQKLDPIYATAHKSMIIINIRILITAPREIILLLFIIITLIKCILFLFYFVRVLR